MKLWIALFFLFCLPAMAGAQIIMVEFIWTQPDSSRGVLNNEGEVLRLPLADGSLTHYNVFTRVDGGAEIQQGVVPAPHAIADTVSFSLPVPLEVDFEIRVEAVDTGGRKSIKSKWSDVLTLEPGPPDEPGKAVVRKVFLGIPPNGSHLPPGGE